MRLSAAVAACVLALCVCFASAQHAHEHEDLFEALDLNGDGFLNYTEVSLMVTSYINDPEHIEEESAGCANVTELIHENDANEDDKLDEDESKGMAFMFLPCLAELTCAAEGELHIVGLEGDGVETLYHCTAGEHDDHHDDRRRRLEGDDEHEEDHGPVELVVGNVEWTCEEESEDTVVTNDRLSKGEAWGLTMLAVSLITLLSLAGVLLLGSSIQMIYKYAHDVAAFAAGALLAGALLHVLPEAAAESSFDKEIAAYVLGGFVFTLLLEQVIRLYRVAYGASLGIDAQGHNHGQAAASGSGGAGSPPGQPATKHIVVSESKAVGDDPAPSGDEEVASPSHLTANMSRADLLKSAAGRTAAETRYLRQNPTPLSQAHPVVWIILIGDFVHNLVDGIAIAAGFLACDSTVGWSVTLAVALHELPQELSDFVILLAGGLSRKVALLFNFISALGAFLGAFIVLGADKLVDADVSARFLAVSGGVLIYIGATDLLPDVLTTVSVKRVVRQVFLFLLAVGIVSLTLLHDKHCERGLDGSVHAHAH